MNMSAEIDQVVQSFVTDIVRIALQAANAWRTVNSQRAIPLGHYKALTIRVHAFIHMNPGTTMVDLVRQVNVPASELGLSLWELRLRGDVGLRPRGGVMT